jgi:hypothetical protein
MPEIDQVGEIAQIRKWLEAERISSARIRTIKIEGRHKDDRNCRGSGPLHALIDEESGYEKIENCNNLKVFKADLDYGKQGN